MAIDFQEDDNNIDFQLDFQEDEPSSRKPSTLMENIGGTAAALGDIATGLVKVPLTFGAAVGGKLRTPDVSTEAHRMAAQDTVESVIPSIGSSVGGGESDAYKNIMKPFELLGEGIDFVGDKVGEFTGSKNMSGATKLALDFGSLGVGIPGVKLAGKAAGKAISHIDPAIRNAGKDKVAAMEVMRKQAELDAAKKPKVVEEPVQMDLFDLDNQGKAANQFEAQQGVWRIDENGMPIRADLSIEAQNMETPLQRGLWGDELPPRESPRGQSADLPMDRDILGHEKLTQDVAPDNIGITQAMDNTKQAARMSETLEDAVARRDQVDAQVNMLSHDLDAPPGLERARMDAEVTTLRSPFTDPTIPIRSTGKFSRQRGAVNPDLFKEGYEAIKNLGNYTLRVVGQQPGPEVLILDKNKNIIGSVTTTSKWKGDTQNLEADMVHIDKDHRGHRLAEAAYKFLAEQGNDIRKSDVQLPDGIRMWEKFEADGLASDGMIRKTQPRIPLSQRGAVGNLSGSRKVHTLMDDLRERFAKETDTIPNNPDPKVAVQEALLEGKDGKAINVLESGSTLAAMKRGSAAVTAGSRIIQNAVKHAELNIRRHVQPTEKALRHLSRADISTLQTLMMHEMLSGKRFDPEALGSLSVKSQEAYAHMRHMFEDTLRIQNEARAAKGQKPMTELEAYLSSRWQGDFRRPVFQTILDKNGNPKIKPDGTLERKLVWYLASNTKGGLESQWKALKKEHPDLTFDPKEDHVVRSYKNETDLQSMYTTLVDILGRDDPAVEKITAAVKQQAVNEAASFLGQEKHFKEKTGVRGFIGDRPGKDGVKEALAMFQQQIQYAKNAYKWSELQKAAVDLKEIVGNKELAEQQPNNVKYIKEYFKNNVGYGEAKAIAHLEDSVRGLGFSPSMLDAGVGSVKSFFILQKLAVNTGYTVANVLQTANVLPHVADLYAKGYKGNVLKAIPMGIAGGIAMATGHYANFLGGKGSKLPMIHEGVFLNKAFKYAEDNGITSRSLYDESPIDASFSKVGVAANVLGKTMSVPETFVRSISYMTFVQFLKDSKKFKNDNALFQKAEELTNAAMVDYRAGERPMVFAKLGTIGNFLNTLQTYPVNWYNQWNYFGRQAAKGNVAPIATALALQYTIAGASGIPGFEDMDKLYGVIRDNLLPASTYTKVRENDFLSDPKLWAVKHSSPSVYGWLSDLSGVGFTSRVAAPGAGQMLQSPLGPITDIGKQLMNVGNAVVDPSKDNLAQVAMASAPPGLQGLIETSDSMEGSMWDNRQNPSTGKTERIYNRPGNVGDHLGIVTRSPEEETLRKFGLRSQRETVEREIGYRTANNTKTAEKKARSIPDALYAAAKSGNTERARELYDAFVKLTGSEISDEAWDAQVRENYFTSVERASNAAKTVSAMRDVARMNQILRNIKNERKQGR